MAVTARCLGDKHKVYSPPYSRNWSIGCRGTSHEGSGEYDNWGGPVGPWSLYLQQLRDRLGDAALRHMATEDYRLLRTYDARNVLR